jgi:hypothetical protein
MSQKRNVTLLAFLKGSTNPADRMPGCANYDHDHGGCLLETVGEKCPCLVVDEHKRCPYFERAVLPTAADIGQREHVYGLYEQTVGAVVDTRKTRRRTGDPRPCPDCGGVLRPRQRICDDCQKRRRKQTYRASQRKRRLERLGVNS